VFIFGSLFLLVVIFLLIGKFYPGSGADQLDWKPTRSYEDEVRLELDDVDQMIEAQNERRRRDGRPEITEDQIRAEVDQAERRRKEDSDRYKDSAEVDQVEREEIEQLIEMKNERLRRAGQPEITAEQFEAELEQAEQLRRSGGDPGGRS